MSDHVTLLHWNGPIVAAMVSGTDRDGQMPYLKCSQWALFGSIAPNPTPTYAQRTRVKYQSTKYPTPAACVDAGAPGFQPT
jgi:hypothetical protein